MIEQILEQIILIILKLKPLVSDPGMTDMLDTITSSVSL